MAPSTTAPKSAAVRKRGTRMGGTVSTSREVTPTASKPAAMEMATKGDAEQLAGIFKADLTNLREIVTCSICDQFLYEPFTLLCGHTYCYSCLCNWFVPNKRKKTCPDCRTKVKHMPGPNFLIKQMVEIFAKRTELMPADESVEQHSLKRSEEIAEVENDRKAPGGLFKGTFKSAPLDLLLDEEDNVARCPGCGHEHEGGPACVHCGAELNDDNGDYSDMESDDYDEDDMDDLSGLDIEVGAEFPGGFDADFEGEIGGHRWFLQHPRPYQQHSLNHTYDSDGSAMGSEDEEDQGSLRDFVDDDEEPPSRFGRIGGFRPRNSANITNEDNRNVGHQTITISDDESDEGGVVSNRRRRRIPGGFPSSTPPVINLTDTSVDGSEAGEEELLHAGWSPLADSGSEVMGSLDQGNDSDPDGQVHFGYEGYTGDENSDDDSDTNTATAGNGFTDDEDVYERRESVASMYMGSFLSDNPDGHKFDDGLHPRPETPDIYDFHSRDHDGDSEMTSSTRSVSVATSVSTNNHDAGNIESLSSRGASVSTDYDGDSDVSAIMRGPERGRGASVDSHGGYGMGDNPGLSEFLGAANEVHEFEDGSSDESPRPPPRRLPRHYHPNPRVRQYDPRISMMFAEHQQTIQDITNEPARMLAMQWGANEVQRVEPASRRRPMTAYRQLSPRRADPLRSSRSPSAIRVLSVADRSSRRPRQYIRY